MTLQVLGTPRQEQGDTKLDQFIAESREILKQYRAILDQNLTLLQTYLNTGGKEDLGLAMIGTQLKALNKQLTEAEDGTREANSTFIAMMDKRLTSTVKAIEDYSETGINPKFSADRQAQVDARMAALREAKARKKAEREAATTAEHNDTQVQAVEAQTEAVEQLVETLEEQADVAEDTARKSLLQRLRDRRAARDEERVRSRNKSPQDDAKERSGLTTKLRDKAEAAYEASSGAISAGSSNFLKVGLSAILGPASPIVNVLDNLVGFDKLTDRMVAGINPFSRKAKDDTTDEAEAEPQVSAIERLKTKVTDGLLGVRTAVEVGMAKLTSLGASEAKDRKLDAQSQKVQDALVLDRLKDLGQKPDDKDDSGPGMIGKLLSSGFSLVGGWLSKVVALLGAGAALNKLRGVFGGGGGGGGLGGGVGKAGKAGGKMSKLKGVGKVLGPIAGLMGAYEVGSNFLGGPEAGARDRSGLDRGLDYGSGALSGAAAGALVGSIIPGIGTAIGAGVGAVIGTASVAWKEYGDVAIKGVKSAGKASVAWVSSTFDDASTALSNFSRDLKAKASSLADAGRTKLDEAGKALTVSLVDFSKWLTSVGDNLMGAIKAVPDALKALPGKIVAAAREVPALVKKGAEVAVEAARAAPAYVERKGSELVAMAKGVSGKAISNWNGGAKQDLIDASSKAGVDVGTLAKIAHFESKFDASAAPIAVGARSGMNTVKQHDGRMAISSAHGYGQFIDDSWKDAVNKHGSKYGVEGAGKLTKEQANKLRGDKKLQAGMLAEFTKENIEKGRALGGSSDDANVYAFHNLGAGDATALLKGMKTDPKMSVRQALMGGSSDPKKAARIESVIKGNSSLYGDGSISVEQAYAKMDGHMKGGEFFAADARKAMAPEGGATTAVATAVPPSVKPSTTGTGPSVVATKAKDVDAKPATTATTVTQAPTASNATATSPSVAATHLAVSSAVAPTAVATAGATKPATTQSVVALPKPPTAEAQRQVADALKATKAGSTPQEMLARVNAKTGAMGAEMAQMMGLTSPPAAVPSASSTQVAALFKPPVATPVSSPPAATAKVATAAATLPTDLKLAASAAPTAATPLSKGLQPIPVNVGPTPMTTVGSTFSGEAIIAAMLGQAKKQDTASGDASKLLGTTKKASKDDVITIDGTEYAVPASIKAPGPEQAPTTAVASPGAATAGAKASGDVITIDGTEYAVPPSIRAAATPSTAVAAAPSSKAVGAMATAAPTNVDTQKVVTAQAETPVTASATAISARAAAPAAVPKAVMEVPPQKGSINAPAAAPAATATKVASAKTTPSGSLLNISNIPMFVNDWGMLNVNSHGVV